MKRSGPIARSPLKQRKAPIARSAPFAVRTVARTRAPKQPKTGSVDKSELAFGSAKRERSPAHMAFVATFPCLVCKSRPVTVHHLRHAQPIAKGLKSGDQWTVPLCPDHHQNGPDAVHRWEANGGTRGEAGYWLAAGIDPMPIAEELWANSPARSGSP